ncbi:hypothetical protein MSG28_014697 [Choristoneura fumiferana]|uniref:Uncharacterized protein n=1 Tax=Choristoneura fumiferana TaxID=7141 RepID=A0ACC0JS82_CHOFU|nr:hypothetical protein MSG28_014697 [Choristoneura fumiferana]
MLLSRRCRRTLHAEERAGGRHRVERDGRAEQVAPHAGARRGARGLRLCNRHGVLQPVCPFSTFQFHILAPFSYLPHSQNVPRTAQYTSYISGGLKCYFASLRANLRVSRQWALVYSDTNRQWVPVGIWRFLITAIFAEVVAGVEGEQKFPSCKAGSPLSEPPLPAAIFGAILRPQRIDVVTGDESWIYQHVLLSGSRWLGSVNESVPVLMVLLQDYMDHMHTHVAAHAEGGRGRRCQEHSLRMCDFGELSDAEMMTPPEIKQAAMKKAIKVCLNKPGQEGGKRAYGSSDGKSPPPMSYQQLNGFGKTIIAKKNAPQETWQEKTEQPYDGHQSAVN